MQSLKNKETKTHQIVRDPAVFRDEEFNWEPKLPDDRLALYLAEAGRQSCIIGTKGPHFGSSITSAQGVLGLALTSGMIPPGEYELTGPLTSAEALPKELVDAQGDVGTTAVIRRSFEYHPEIDRIYILPSLPSDILKHAVHVARGVEAENNLSRQIARGRNATYRATP